METEQAPTLVDQLFQVLEQLILPNWNDLITLVPWVLIVLIVIYVIHTAWQWRRAAEINRPRVPRPAFGSAPPGVHLPGPSRWPFVVPIGAAILLFALAVPPRDAEGNATAPFNGLLLLIGLIVLVVSVVGWLRDAMREWRATAQGHDSIAVALAPGTRPVAQLHGGPGTQMTPATAHAIPVTAYAMAPATALVPAGVHEATVYEAAAYEPRREPPPGVHLPGPSPWPFLAPIAMTVIFFGVIFSAVLIVGGLILGIIAAGGWLLDAGREYRSTERVGHAVAGTHDPAEVWPRRLVRVFAVVIVVSVIVTLLPLGQTWLNGLAPGAASPTPEGVPAVPEITASSSVSFETDRLLVPAGRGFELIFNNNESGSLHNVEVADGPARATVYLDGEVITGVASITYQVPALDEGDYYFLCKIHPNMNGTLLARPEAGPPPAPGSPGSSPPAPGPPAGSPGSPAAPGSPGSSP